jgi:hypothetical protein
MQGGRHLEEAASANGRPKYVPGTTFYLRYKRNCWEPVGKDLDAAMAAKRRREIALEGVLPVFSLEARMNQGRTSATVSPCLGSLLK